MTWIEALVLGLLQGLTEFLPVSSSGHIELGTVLLGIKTSSNLLFSILVHAATALSTLVVFRNEVFDLLKSVLRFEFNDNTRWVAKIVISIIPVGIVGLLFEDEIEQLFSGKVLLVGSMLIVTGSLLTFTYFNKDHSKNISYITAFIIGIAQSIAIMPGISRSGATIATALLLKIDKEEATRFSFLMVLIPIIGASLLKLKELIEQPVIEVDAHPGSLFIGFLAAFISGLLACRWMITIVKKGKLVYFAIYCFFIGSIAIISQFL